MTTARPARLGDIVAPVQSWTPSRSVDDSFRYIDLSAIDQNIKEITGARDVPCDEAPSRARQRVATGDVLVSTVRPNLNAVARVPETLDSATASTGFCILRPRTAKVDGAYLFHWVKTPAFVADMVKKATGASYPAVSDSIVLNSHIPLPSLGEQKHIAEILDRAQEVRTKRLAALTQLDSLTQAIFLDLFGDPDSILAKWPTQRLGELLSFLTSGSRGWAVHYAESGSLFLRIQNVRRDELLLEDVAYVRAPVTAEARRTRVEPGDVLLSITADLGRTAVVPNNIGEAFINQHLSILRTNAIAPRFLSAYLASPRGQREVAGRNRQAVKAGLNFDDIRSFMVPLPPAELQAKFVRGVAAVEKLKAAHRASLAEMDALFASLQHRAFRGGL